MHRQLKFYEIKYKWSTMVETLAAVHKDKQRSVIQVLTLKDVLGREIHVRMCVVYRRVDTYSIFVSRIDPFDSIE